MQLIYLLSFGDPIYHRMTDVCVASLRGPGRYRDDIVVLTDGRYKTPRTDVRTLDVSALLEDHVRSLCAKITTQDGVFNTAASDSGPGDPSGAARKLIIKCMKAFAAPLIDHTRYDRIAVMDTDMVAISDINPLLRVDGRSITGMQERGLSTMLSDSCGGDLLSPEERKAAGETWGINTGFLVMSAGCFQHSMSQWAEAVRNDLHKANFWADQPYLNVLVLRDRLRFTPLPDRWIDMPPQYIRLPQQGQFHLDSATRLLHLWWDDKALALAQMEAILGALSENRSRPELARLIRRQLAAMRR